MFIKQEITIKENQRTARLLSKTFKFIDSSPLIWYNIHKPQNISSNLERKCIYMIRDYKQAKKLADKALKKAKKSSTSPYLPVLDIEHDPKNFLREVRTDLMELPVNRIKGTKELSRANAFADNFMPLHGLGSEFACKWANLYDTVALHGVRDAIKVYEFMHEYYVLEGNKRVSVSKFSKIDFILADVIRILPRRNGSDEVEAYYEYLDFYNVTKNYYITFNKPGSYKKLAELLGQNLTTKWSENILIDLKATYFQFIKKFNSVIKIEDNFKICDAFLTYISKFSFESLLTDEDKKIKKNIKLNKNELLGIKKEFADNNNAYSQKAFGLKGLLINIKNTFIQNYLEFSE